MATPAAVLSILVEADGINRTQGELKAMDARLDSVGKRGGLSLGKVAKGAGLASAAFVGLAGVGLKNAADAFYESEKVAKQTDAVLKSTGGAANLTSKQISDLATSISNKTGVDDEAIQSGENLLLTFTKVRDETGKGNDIFSQATKTITDMSVALGQDTKSSAIQLGKALNDPIKGVTALQRVGVSFTESQKEQIKGLVEHGKTLDAQKIILKELGNEFGGSAEAQATASDKMKVALGNLQETIGGLVVPAIEKVAGVLTPFITGLQDGTGAGGAFRDAMVDAFGKAKGAIVGALTIVQGFLHQHKDDLDAIAEAARNVWTAMKTVWQGFILPMIQRVLPAIQQIVTGVFKAIGGAIDVLVGLLTGDFGRAWDGVKAIFEGGAKAALGAVRAMTAPMREVAALVGGAIVSGIKDGLDALKNAGTWIFNTVKDSLNAVKDSILGLGTKVIGWIADGIKAAPKLIADAAGWLKDKIVHAIESAFGFGSPSKVMMDLGGRMAMSVIKGFTDVDIMSLIRTSFGGVNRLAGKLFGGSAPVGAPIVGGGTVGGLVPQVVRALAWARGHGWHGTVTSGFRSYAEQAALYARYLAGGPLAAKPGTSSHETGQAVDVTDYGAFAQAMRSAPAGARLLNFLGAADPVHFSVSGYAGGTMGARRGWGLVGERGPELVRFRGGEQVLPNGASSGPVVNIEYADMRTTTDVNLLANKLAFRIAAAG